jgi:regulator of sirC expression with transglutaminase-like and TPR domain
LESLLDDPSPTVREAVVVEIQRLGEPAYAWLEELAGDATSPLATAAESLLHALAVPGVMAAVRRFIRSRDEDLETGSILLQRVAHPRIDPERITTMLDGIAGRARELLAVPTTPAMIVRATNRVLYHELGYRGEPDRNPDPGTILLGDLLALRRGIPLSMAILYLLVAKRLGMEFEPVFLPNRVLLGYFRDREPFLVDPYARGRFFSWAEAQAMVPIEGLLGLQRLWPSFTGALLRRLCQRLVEVYGGREERERAQVFGEFIREFEETTRRTDAQ